MEDLYNNTSNFTQSPTSYNSTSDDQHNLHEDVWFAVRIIMIIAVCFITLVVCYLRSKFKKVEDGNLGSLDQQYQHMHTGKHNVIHMSNKIIEMTDTGEFKEIELTENKKRGVKDEDMTYVV